jgi:hypothetical protein
MQTQKIYEFATDELGDTRFKTTVNGKPHWFSGKSTPLVKQTMLEALSKMGCNTPFEFIKG